ncbi:MAG: PEGA domain-containing protein [Deltaproteobacteria bacterium]|nr:PEGA domain-containing protein [Deltaproteobacteria bacterium]
MAFEAAKTLNPNLTDIDALLEVTRKLGSEAAEKAAAKAEPPPSAPVAAVAPVREERPVVRSAPSRRASRSEPTRRARTETPAPEAGLILVTAEPAGLGVYVDGQPRDITPRRVEVPPGRHQVELRKGAQVLAQHSVNVSAGGVAVVAESPKIDTPETEPVARAVTADPSTLKDDGSLDLVALLDREEPGTTPEPRRETVTTPTTDRWTPTPAGSRPRLVAYVPGKSASSVQSALRSSLPGIQVDVVARAADLKPGTPADAILAPPSAASQAGLTTRLSAQGGGGRYVLASFNPIPSKDALPALTVAVVGELDRKAMPERVRSILGTANPPRLRRVTKPEDLLSSLQLGLAQAFLVRAEDFPALKQRTRQTLNEQTYSGGGGVGLVVAYVDGGRGETVGSALRSMTGQGASELGVQAWAAR